MNKNEFELGGVYIEVIQKEIQNLHLSVYPPNGRVRISAPKEMDMDTIRIYTISKFSWIKKQQRKFKAQARETKRDYISRESHYYLGRRYLLRIFKGSTRPSIERKYSYIDLCVPPGISKMKKHTLILDWYRKELKQISEPIFNHWVRKLNLNNVEFSIRIMKTRWGSCNREKRKIWLNLELVKKPKECIEYIIVHELLHFFEKNHSPRFNSLMSKYCSNWKDLREKLNRLPISHIDWEY
ncbi:M48 family metallopeptidase [Leptospira johnsonii]|uniref:M48 family metallopeptidase n=1 Tax=Leptospira johnsonii TaxID=1917820 RepID=UPI00249F1789|nr:SprT family zinc-dependent metalloprotease [Leptospira johnsonii]